MLLGTIFTLLSLNATESMLSVRFLMAKSFSTLSVVSMVHANVGCSCPVSCVRPFGLQSSALRRKVSTATWRVKVDCSEVCLSLVLAKQELSMNTVSQSGATTPT